MICLSKQRQLGILTNQLKTGVGIWLSKPPGGTTSDRDGGIWNLHPFPAISDGQPCPA